MADGSSAAVETLLQPRAEPPREGLTIIGKPIWFPRAETRAAAPSSRKISWGSATWGGVRIPASATTVVAIDLSKATRDAGPIEPTNGTRSSASTSRKAPSSPASPCRTGKTTAPGSSDSRGTSAESTSDSITSSPWERKAWPTRRPERSETSRSCDRPPARTTTVLGSPSRWGSGGVRVTSSFRSRLVGTRGLVRGQRGPGGRRAHRGAEGLEYPGLVLQHLPEAPRPLEDAFWGGEAVGQTHIAAAEPIGVERGAWDVGHPRRHRARQHGVGVQTRRQGRPDEEAAGRDRPGGAVGHVLGQPRQHRVPTLPVHLAENLDLAPPVVVHQVGGDGVLGEHGRTQRRGLLRQDELLADRVRGQHPADPEAGSKGLGEGAQVDYPVLIQRADRRRRIALEAEQPVGVVLHHQQVGLLGHPQDGGTPLQGLGDARGVVEVGDGVEELDRPP